MSSSHLCQFGVRGVRLSAAGILPLGRRAFRADVQGLRAVAVASVVGYHLWPHAVPGGFAGVDVFFVISGFLITEHLVGELLTRGTVSLSTFWARRIRRILPAACTVLAACLAVTVLVMPRMAWSANVDEIRAAALYGENWLLGIHAINYLAAENTPSLVQHYWSLSVEEQFYLCWPLLVLLAGRLGRGKTAPQVRRRVTVVLGLTGLASFVTSVVWTHLDQPLAFFATPVRAWEFAAGALAGIVLPRVGEVMTMRGRRAVASLGLAVVVSSMWMLSGSDAFPGWIALLPVTGAALVLLAAADGAPSSPTRLLSLRPVQWLGDNSYAVYLWHWPLIIAAPWVVHGPVSAAAKVAIAVLSCALAAATKRLVEDPIRTGSLWQARRWPAYSFAVGGIAALALFASAVPTSIRPPAPQVQAVARAQEHRLVASSAPSCFGAEAMVPENGCRDPFLRPPHLDLAFAAADGRTDPCLQSGDMATPTFCTLGTTRAPLHTIAIVGNSHAWRLVPALALFARQHRWELVVAARTNCLGLTSTPIGAGGATANCLRWSASVQQRLLAWPHLDAVVFASYRYADEFLAGMHRSDAQESLVRRQITETWQRFTHRGIHVVVVGDVPGMRPTDDPTCLAQSAARDDPCAVRRSTVVQSNVVADTAQADPQLATYVPLTQFFCDARKCHAVIGGVVVYFDSHHMTTTFSRSLARYLGGSVAAVLG